MNDNSQHPHNDDNNQEENTPDTENFTDSGGTSMSYEEALAKEIHSKPTFKDPDIEEITGEENTTEENLSKDSEIERLTAELATAKDQMMRALADAENTRRRAVRDREDGRKYAITDFSRDLLDFSDNFKRAIDAIPADLSDTDERVQSVVSGIQAMDRDIISTFEKHGIRKIKPIDEPFDPNFHEVMFETPGTGKAPGIITEIIEPGYMLHDRLLRPARVSVAKDDGSYKGGTEVNQEI